MLRQRAEALTQQHREQMRTTRGLLVSANTQRDPCPTCGNTMVVEKTLRRHVSTLAHGYLEVRETVLVCGEPRTLPGVVTYSWVGSIESK